MVRKLLGVLGLTICLIAMTMMIASADPPTPTDQARGKPTTPPGLSKTPAAEKGKEKEKEKEQEQDKEKGKHAVFGLVVGKGENSFVVKPKQGDGNTVTVTVNEKTRFQIPTNKDAGFKDLNVNDQVAVNGTPVAGGLEAKKVGIVPGKPSVQHRVGTVTAYTAGASITIEDQRGDKSTFKLNQDTEIRDPKGTGIKVRSADNAGSKVTIVSRRDLSTNTFTAQAIVVHPN